MTYQEHRWILSGGLASGKSQVRRLLEEHGFHTIDADRVGHDVLRSEGPAFDEVVTRWPDIVADGEVDRRALAAVVFNDPVELAALEAITHPHIFDMINARVEDVDEAVVVEVPVLGHSLGPDWRRIVVDCRDEIRLERAISRGMAAADAQARMASQPSRAEWLAVADVVLPNTGTLLDLRHTVDRWTSVTGV
ncbi:MAG: dephospho-CoA kinase [Actinomycetota bacterium]